MADLAPDADGDAAVAWLVANVPARILAGLLAGGTLLPSPFGRAVVDTAIDTWRQLNIEHVRQFEDWQLAQTMNEWAR